MGGLHSGRARRHTCIDDCLTIDTAWLRKQKILGKSRSSFSITWKKWTETDFTKTRERAYLVQAYYRHGEHPTLTLDYRVTLAYDDYRSPQERSYTETIQLASTPCNYGGERWWFIAPCCGARVRVLYINPKRGELSRMTPQCRTCLDLHYASQMQSYIERHKTYERYLLANYGLYWASYRYDFELKEHYLEMTPGLWALRMQSVIDWNLHLLKTVIRCDLTMYRADLANLKSLRSEEDRRVCLEHMRKKEREMNSLGLVIALQQCIAYERLVYEVNTRAMPDHLFELYQQITDLGRDPLSQVQPNVPQPSHVKAVEQKIINLEAILKQVSKAEKKQAA